MPTFEEDWKSVHQWVEDMGSKGTTGLGLLYIEGSLSRIRKEHDRLLQSLSYLADCHAATAEMDGALKSTSKRRRERFATICSKAAKMLGGADLPETRLRRKESVQGILERCRLAAKDLSE